MLGNVGFGSLAAILAEPRQEKSRALSGPGFLAWQRGTGLIQKAYETDPGIGHAKRADQVPHTAPANLRPPYRNHTTECPILQLLLQRANITGANKRTGRSVSGICFHQ